MLFYPSFSLTVLLKALLTRAAESTIVGALYMSMVHIRKHITSASRHAKFCVWKHILQEVMVLCQALHSLLRYYLDEVVCHGWGVH